ncbi:MAG: amino acid permease [Spirochaetes bacterium]|nr:MAG: amino acid permease [Spirochaetota bacterium]
MNTSVKETGAAPGAHTFRRELRLMDATMLVMGSMIGSGIFIVSADIARGVGSPGYLLLVWLIAGLITIVGALAFGELTGLFPWAGGQYVFIREAYNPLIGFLYGWSLFMVIQAGTIAAVAMAFAKFSAVLFPILDERVIAFDILGFRVKAAQIAAIALIAVLTWVNTRGIRGGKLVQDVFTTAKVAALLGLIALGIILGSDGAVISGNLASFWDAQAALVAGGKLVSVEALAGIALLTAIGTSMVGAIFSSDAWNNITFTAAEVVNPKRTIPLSLAMGTGAVTVLYLLANVAYLAVLPVTGTPDAGAVLGQGIQFAVNDRVATAAASMAMGASAAKVMAVLVMVSTFGCNNGLILAGARVYYAMARDGLFFKSAGVLNGKDVPGAALVMQAVWASILCLSGTYGDLLDYVIFVVLIFYILTVGGVFVLRRRMPGAARPYRMLGYPVVPALYILTLGAIAVDLLIYKPAYTWPGMGIVLLGVPIYFAWSRFSKK